MGWLWARHEDWEVVHISHSGSFGSTGSLRRMAGRTFCTLYFSPSLIFAEWLHFGWASLVAQLVKNPPAMQETWVWSLVWKIPWRSELLLTPVFWPGEFHELYSPWGCKESDTTKRLSLYTLVHSQVKCISHMTPLTHFTRVLWHYLAEMFHMVFGHLRSSSWTFLLFLLFIIFRGQESWIKKENHLTKWAKWLQFHSLAFWHPEVIYPKPKTPHLLPVLGLSSKVVKTCFVLFCFFHLKSELSSIFGLIGVRALSSTLNRQTDKTVAVTTLFSITLFS